MVTELRPTPSAKEKFRRVNLTFLINLFFLLLLGLMIHTPAWLRVAFFQNAQLQEYAGENAPPFDRFSSGRLTGSDPDHDLETNKPVGNDRLMPDQYHRDRALCLDPFGINVSFSASELAF